jgi:hypothetical protein
MRKFVAACPVHGIMPHFENIFQLFLRFLKEPKENILDVRIEAGERNSIY